MSDWKLLREYVDAGSESAFSELAQRHLDMVYSVAWRQLNDVHDAQEVAQSVFCLLAQKARQLSSGTLVGAWLYQTACFKSAEYARADYRRRAREKEACIMESSEANTEAELAWKQLAALLDDAVRHLNESDRQAIVLRFFERKSLREVGLALRLDEDAARKRVSRAVDKLRSWFAKKGVSCSATVLTAAMLANAVQSAPAGIAGAMVKAALAAAAVSASPMVSAILSNLCKTMITKKLIAITAITATVVVPTAIIWKQNRDLRREIAELRPVASEADRLRAENAALARSQIDTNELARLRAGQSELLRLRGQFAVLHQQPANRPGPQPKPATGATAPESTNATRVFNSSVKALIPVGRTLAVGGWSHEPGKRAIALVVPTVGGAPNGPGQITVTATLVEMPDEVWDRLGLSSQTSGSVQNPLESVLDAEQARSFFNTLTNNAGVNIVGAPRVASAGGIPATISISNAEKGTSQSFSLLSSLTADGKDVDLQMDMEITSNASSANGAAQNGGN